MHSDPKHTIIIRALGVCSAQFVIVALLTLYYACKSRVEPQIIMLFFIIVGFVKSPLIASRQVKVIHFKNKSDITKIMNVVLGFFGHYFVAFFLFALAFFGGSFQRIVSEFGFQNYYTSIALYILSRLAGMIIYYVFALFWEHRGGLSKRIDR